MIGINALQGPTDVYNSGSGISSSPYTPYTTGGGFTSPTTGGTSPVPQPSDTRPSSPLNAGTISDSGYNASGPVGGGFKIYDNFGLQDAPADTGISVLPPYDPGSVNTGTYSGSTSVVPSDNTGASTLASIMAALTGLLSAGPSTPPSSGLVATQVPVVTNPSPGSAMPKGLILVAVVLAGGWFAHKRGWF